MDQIVDSFRAGLFSGKQVLVSGGSSGTSDVDIVVDGGYVSGTT